MVLIVARGIAANGGIVIKSDESTERTIKATYIVFDKTETITEAGPDVISQDYPAGHEAEACAIARQLVSGSSHPVSIAVFKHLEQTLGTGDTKSIPGAGFEAKYGNDIVRAGNPHGPTPRSMCLFANYRPRTIHPCHHETGTDHGRPWFSRITFDPQLGAPSQSPRTPGWLYILYLAII